MVARRGVAPQIREVLGRHGRVALDEIDAVTADLVGRHDSVLIHCGWLRIETAPALGGTARKVEWRSVRPYDVDGAEWVPIYRARPTVGGTDG